MASSALRRLARLERSLILYGPGASTRKRHLVAGLRRASLGDPQSIVRLHEALLFLRAYPDDSALHREVALALDEFPTRPDLDRHREALADSGIEGAPIHYRFYWPQAVWLATRWPGRLRLDRDDREPLARLRVALPLIAGQVEGDALGKLSWSATDLLDHLRSSAETDAEFLLRRVAALPGDSRTREAFHDGIDLAYRLEPASGGPSRAQSQAGQRRIRFRTGPPDRTRPDLRSAIGRPPRSVRRLPVREAEWLIETAREAMVTRARELEVFSWANSRDVHLVDDGDGLAFAFIGVRPERRPLLHASYAALSLRNGIPIGYFQCDVLLANGSISYNTFATFRGGEAAFVFGRILAATHRLFGTRVFSVEPYQLGHKNAEGLDSAAWWFYRKLGFRPRDASVERLARSEERRMRHDPDHRSAPPILRRLAKKHLFFELTPGDGDTAPPLPWPIGLLLTSRRGHCESRVRRLMGSAEPRNGSKNEREAWLRLCPLLLAIPGFRRWPVAERRAAALALRSKGSTSERTYLRRVAGHRRLTLALDRLARQAARLAESGPGLRSRAV